MNQLGGLLLNGGDDFGMAVPRRADGDACGEIQKCIAVNVLDNRATAALGDERIVPRIGRRHEFGVVFHNALGVGSGQYGNQLR